MDPNLSQDQATAVLFVLVHYWRYWGWTMLELDGHWTDQQWTIHHHHHDDDLHMRREEEHTGDKWVWTNRSINRPICRVAVMIRIIISIDMISLSVWVKDYTLDPHSQSTPLCV
uniref:Uncharacterized protein n=1 Tax=Oryza glumipatula TaxID=40148 RepID=A0A0E0BJY5_9ORYZ